MDHFLLLIILLVYSILTNAQTGTNTSITQTSWFWPLLGTCLALLISVPCTLIIIVVICHIKHKSDDDSDESSISSSSSSSTAVQQETRHRHSRRQPSHYAGTFRSPPPPYTASQQPQNPFVTSSRPPSYHSPINQDEQTMTANPPIEISVQPRTLDTSFNLTSASIQTFQA